MSVGKVIVIGVVAVLVAVGGVLAVDHHRSQGDASTKSSLVENLSGLAGKRDARASDFANSPCANGQPGVLTVAAGGVCSVSLPSKVGAVTLCATPGSQVRMVGTDYPATVSKGSELACPAGHILRVYDERTVISLLCPTTAPCQFSVLGKAD